MAKKKAKAATKKEAHNRDVCLALIPALFEFRINYFGTPQKGNTAPYL